jgi:hypothetical protein
MQQEMEDDVGNELPLLFPERSSPLFPKLWKWRHLPPGSHKTPERDSDEWKAIMKFKNSGDWKRGDLQKFAKYFDVAVNSLCTKIKDSLAQTLPSSDEVTVAAEGGCSSQGDNPSPLPCSSPPPSTLPPCSPPRPSQTDAGRRNFGAGPVATAAAAAPAGAAAAAHPAQHPSPGAALPAGAGAEVAHHLA